MKQFYICVLAFFFSVMYVFAWEGEGTSQNPYKISSAEDLVQLSQTSGYSGSHEGKFFEMTQDIDMSAITDFTAIGFQYNAFKGNFDGKNFKVKNLVIRRGGMDNATIALFGAVENGTIQNVHITEASYIEGNKYVAAIVGYIQGGKVINCSSSAKVEANGVYSQSIAGIVGEAFNSEVKNCINTGMVSVPGNNTTNIGGIVGLLTNGATMSGCYNLGTITGASKVGGVCGSIGTGETISDCYNKGAVSGTKEYVGGVLGYAPTGLLSVPSLTKCYNAGNVSGKDYVGGVVGRSANTSHCCNIGSVGSTGMYTGGVSGAGYVNNCYNKGNITGGTTATGGIVGTLSGLSDCYNTGNVTGTNNVGGIVGQMNGTENELFNSYNTGNVTATAVENVFAGGIAGYVNTGGFINSNKIKNSYWNVDASVSTGKGVGNFTEPIDPNTNFQYSGKSVADLKQSSFPAVLGAGWAQDINSINNGYPVLTGDIAGLSPVVNTIYTITASAGANGTISPSGEIKVVEGAASLFTITPSEGYEINQVLVDGVNVGKITAYNFENIDRNSTFSVTFKREGATILEELNLSVVSQTLIADVLEIKNSEGYDLKISDISGRIVFAKQNISVFETISVSFLPQGIYLVQLGKGNAAKAFKIIKQ